MPDVQCFTSISFSYLDRARVLAETLKRFQPNWAFWVVLSDRPPPGFAFDADSELFDRVVWLEELGIPGLPAWTFKHDVVELCTAVKGQMLVRLLEQGAQKVVYLDPDIAVFGSLSEVEELLDQACIVLTPHIVTPEEGNMAIVDSEIGTLKHGTYNLGFLAVANRPDGLRFARWWRDRLRYYCYDDVQEGLFTDQRWCDLAPGLFEGVSILRDVGYNVASWNLNNRPIGFGADGRIMAGDRPLRFFHFTKVNSVGEVMLARYSRGQTEVFELLKWYRARLAANAPEGLPKAWWAYGIFEDGSPITRHQRLLYRHREDLNEAFPDPFATSGTCYRDWYAARPEHQRAA
jgi:hypothetical protein